MSVSILIPYILVFKDDDEESRGGSSSRSGSDSGSDSGAESRKKHKKKKRNKRRHDEEIDEIDEEDLALMEENLGIKIKKQRRRIRMDSDDDEPEETGTEDGSRRGRLEGNDDLPDIQVNIYSTKFQGYIFLDYNLTFQGTFLSIKNFLGGRRCRRFWF